MTRTRTKTSRISCFQCRFSKRRCDRTLPSCTLCDKKSSRCSYPRSRGDKFTPSSEDAQSPEEAWNHSATAPSSQSPGPSYAVESESLYPVVRAAHFIAPCVLQGTQLNQEPCEIPVPSEVAAHVGSVSQMREICRGFFKYFHSWMPIVSKQRLYPALLNPLQMRRCELGLLMLCMKLYLTAPPGHAPDGRSSLYRLAKGFYAEVEAAGVLSINILQAAVFIAHYELAQAIFPAAHLTVGSCARYGVALGIDRLMSDKTGSGQLAGRRYVEIEEMRRVWWAIIILDRFLNIGCPSRLMATPDPVFGDYLPVDDVAFDNGTATAEDVVSISTGFKLKMGVFSRLAQATFLLSQALQFVSSTESSRSSAGHGHETAQLRRTLESLIHLADKEIEIRQIEFCTQSIISYSAILMLQKHHWQNHSQHGACPSEHTFPETQPALDALSDMAKSVGRSLVGSIEEQSNYSILTIHVAYQAAEALITQIYDGCTEEVVDTAANDIINHFKDNFEALAPRWRISAVYRTLMDAHEATLLSKV